MTLEQLRIFVAVAAREHMTRAAEDLAMTQSAVSAAVTALEVRHGVRLFDRVGRRIALTDVGRVFLGEARAVLARAGAAEAVLADLVGLRRGTLSIAASQTVANYWLPAHIARFQNHYPGLDLAVSIGNTEAVAGQLHQGTIDLGLVEGEVDDPHLAIRTIAEDELVLVVAPTHPWAVRGGITSRDLGQSRWVIREEGSGTRAFWEQSLLRHGTDPDLLVERTVLPSNEAVRTAVVAGGGAAILSRLVVDTALRTGDLVALLLDLPRRRFSALRHKERYQTQALRAFLAILDEPPGM